ncbi:ABC transporter ATP-binding protein [Fusibacter ferrireducens]|uniref:ABC transporter ATP-binding protein n=1 Tax=Fusibacter ferrireducens TaxID=2785058 RepID=A0ABR9ZX32_9FIRM|nr:ABC transporter ATP-binding protein [Fusibacter ferrireducens]MBF4695017.1 ABC transporter ATP-binding protein [Fusibacter ferrireducens]
MTTSEAPLLEVRNVAKHYGKGKRAKEVLTDLNFTLNEGEVLGIIGESGCGKSVLLNLISCLEPVSNGQLFFRGEEYTGRKPSAVCRWFQVIFQDSEAAFDPKRTIRESMHENLRQLSGNVADADKKIKEMVALMGLDAQLVDRYPRQLSGGQVQRMSIARGLITEPNMILCDEITSALDVSAQAMIMQYMYELRMKRGLTMIFVSHDLALCSTFCDRIAIMQEGKIIEIGTPDQIMDEPKEDYTKLLLDAVIYVK